MTQCYKTLRPFRQDSFELTAHPFSYMTSQVYLGHKIYKHLLYVQSRGRDVCNVREKAGLNGWRKFLMGRFEGAEESEKGEANL